jgi:hypothetical protein
VQHLDAAAVTTSRSAVLTVKLPSGCAEAAPAGSTRSRSERGNQQRAPHRSDASSAAASARAAGEGRVEVERALQRRAGGGRVACRGLDGADAGEQRRDLRPGARAARAIGSASRERPALCSAQA